MGDSYVVLLVMVLIVGGVLSLIAARNARMGGGGFLRKATAESGYVDGTLTVTNAVQGAADRNGDRTFTVTGMIIGPGAPAVEVYGQWTMRSGGRVPIPGQDMPVVYRPEKVESTWRFGTLADSVG